MVVDPQSDISVRLAIRADEDDLMAIAREVHPQTAIRGTDGGPLPIDDDLVRSELRRAITHDRSNLPSFIGVVGGCGEIKASIYLACETMWYSSAPVLCDRWVYVHPDHRKGNLASTLYDFAKRAARASNLPLNVGILTQGREAAKARLLRRYFGEPIALGFLYYHHSPDLAGQELTGGA
jgi:GNAT superfamily N-acetyltransferase